MHRDSGLASMCWDGYLCISIVRVPVHQGGQLGPQCMQRKAAHRLLEGHVAATGMMIEEEEEEEAGPSRV